MPGSKGPRTQGQVNRFVNPGPRIDRRSLGVGRLKTETFESITKVSSLPPRSLSVGPDGGDDNDDNLRIHSLTHTYTYTHTLTYMSYLPPSQSLCLKWFLNLDIY